MTKTIPPLFSAFYQTKSAPPNGFDIIEQKLWEISYGVRRRRRAGILTFEKTRQLSRGNQHFTPTLAFLGNLGFQEGGSRVPRNET